MCRIFTHSLLWLGIILSEKRRYVIISLKICLGLSKDMKKLHDIIKKIFHPKWYLNILFIFITVLGLFYCIIHNMPGGFLAGLFYAFSYYTLVTTCVNGKNLWLNHIVPMIEHIPFLHQLATNVKFRTVVFTKIALLINILYGVFQIMLGIKSQTFWFVTLGAYYILLIGARSNLLKGTSPETFGKDLKAEYRKYVFTGVFLLFMNLIVTGIVTVMFEENRTFEYPGFLIYAMALYAFYTLVLAIYGIVTFRRYNSPVLSATRCVNFACGLIAILSLEIALIHRFSEGNAISFANRMAAGTGFFMAVVMSVLGIGMIYRGMKNLKLLDEESRENEDEETEHL